MDKMESEKEELINIVLSNPDYIRKMRTFNDVLKDSMYELYNRFWQKLLLELESRYSEIPRFLIAEGKEFEQSVSSPTIDQLHKLSKKYLNEADRKGKRNYDLRFGIAVPIVSYETQDLMLGIIIDGAISYRVFVKQQGNLVARNQICQKFIDLCNWTDLTSPECSWTKNGFYILAKYPFAKGNDFSFAKSNFQTFEKLANMDSCVADIINGALDYRKLIFSHINKM